MPTLARNASLRTAIVEARRMGVSVEDRDDIVFSFPGLPVYRRAKCRHDAGLGLLCWLRKVARTKGGA